MPSSFDPSCPFSLPMGREQFADALHKGQGRALMHVMRHGAGGLEDIVLDACLHERRYDPQCEGERTAWVMKIVQMAGMEQRVCDDVVAAMIEPREPHAFWDRDQLYRLSMHLARRGHGAARSALYAAFQKNQDSADVFGGEEIVNLDGADGLLFVAEQMGKWLVSDPGVEVDAHPLHWYDESHTEGDAERILAFAAPQNKSIAAYLRAILCEPDATEPPTETGNRRDGYFKPDGLRFSDRGRSRLDRINALSVDELIREIEHNAPNLGPTFGRVWGRSASDDDVRRVGERMYQESDPSRLAKYLSVFARRALPEFDGRLLQYADHSDERVRRAASTALAQHQHPDVRALALRCAATGRCNERQLKMFTSNYRSGDWALIRDVFRASHDLDHFHGLLSDLLDIYKANPCDEALEPLLKVYEETPCANCRRRSVELLIDTGQAPAWLLEEWQFDGDDYGREAIAKKV